MTSEAPRRGPARRARRSVLASYAVVAVVGLAFFLGSFQYDFYRNVDQVGPGFLPRITGALVTVLGLALMAQELRVGSHLAGDSGVLEDSKKMSRATVVKLLTVFGLITLALLLVPVLGLIVSLVLLVPALTIWVERMPVKQSLILTVAAGVVAYLLFVVALRIPVPMGVFEGVF